MASLVLSVMVREGKVLGGGVERRVTISEAAARKWSSRDVAGNGTVVGKKATVSDIRIERVLGIKHLTHL